MPIALRNGDPGNPDLDLELGLYGSFVTGAKPTENQFRNFIDSFVHKTEDAVSLNGWVSYTLREDSGTEIEVNDGGLMWAPVPLSASGISSVRFIANVIPLVPPFNIGIRLVFESEILDSSLGSDAVAALFTNTLNEHYLIGTPATEEQITPGTTGVAADNSMAVDIPVGYNFLPAAQMRRLRIEVNLNTFGLGHTFFTQPVIAVNYI